MVFGKTIMKQLPLDKTAEAMYSVAMERGWEPTKNELLEAICYSKTWNAEGLYPSEYKGDCPQMFLPLEMGVTNEFCATTLKSLMKGIKSTAKFIWRKITNFGKAKRHEEELEKWLLDNHIGFTLAWNPKFRKPHVVKDWCGAITLQRLIKAAEE